MPGPPAFGNHLDNLSVYIHQIMARYLGLRRAQPFNRSLRGLH